MQQQGRCCPENSAPGTIILVQVNGFTLSAAVPEGTLPGQEFRILLPSHGLSPAEARQPAAPLPLCSASEFQIPKGGGASRPEEVGEWKVAWSSKYTRWYWCADRFWLVIVPTSSIAAGAQVARRNAGDVLGAARRRVDACCSRLVGQ